MLRSGSGGFSGRAGWVFALAVVSCLLLAGCARTEPEEALRAAVAELQRAAQERDPAAIRQVLAEDFVGPDGMDRDAARRMAALYLMGHQTVGVTLGPLDIELRERHATVRFSAVLSGGSGRLLPDRANAWQVETGWRMENAQWRMTSARWTPVL